MARKRTDRQLVDTELARRLFVEVERTSLRDVAERVGIGKTTLDHLMYDINDFPSLETIEKIARYMEMPSYEVLRLAGFDAQLPPDVDQGAALIKLAEKRPELRRVLKKLPKLSPEQTRSLLVYLEVLQRQSSDDDDE